MDDNQNTTEVNELSQPTYAGFGIRLGALLLDLLIYAPIIYLVLYFNHLGKDMYFYTIIPTILFQIVYHIYLPKRYGGTPGKLIIGLKITKINGDDIGWKEAVLRYSYSFILTAFSIFNMISSIMLADNTMYMSLSWTKQSKYLSSFSPVSSKLYMVLCLLWFLSEMIVLLSNKKKRAIHDFMGGTVVVVQKITTPKI